MAAEEFAAEYHRSQITIKKKKKKNSGKRVKSSSVQKQIVKLLTF